MNKQLKANFAYLSTDMRYPLIVFWMVLSAIIVISALIQLFVADGQMVMSFSLSFPIYIFGAIVAFLTVKNTIPYLIKMGATRKCMYAVLGIHFFFLALFNAVVSKILNKVLRLMLGENVAGLIISEDGVAQGIVVTNNGEEVVTINHIADFLGGTWSDEIVIDVAITFFAMAIMFIIGLIFYRYQLIGGFGALGVGLLLFIYASSKGLFDQFYIYVYENFTIALFYQLFAVGVIIYLLSFFLLRKLTV